MSTVASDLVIGKQFAANLVRILEEKGMSQMDLVRATGEGQSTINAICSGRHAPRLGIVTRIAEALGVTIDALTYGPTKN